MRQTLTRAALLATLVAAGAATLSAEIIEQVLVKVNGDIITKTDFEARQVAILRQRNLSPGSDAELRKVLDELTPQIITDAIDEMLLIQRGRELGYRMTDEDFSRVVGQIRKENKLEDDKQFEAALRQEGMTLADLRKSLERQMLIARVQQTQVMAKVGLSEEEARQYHAEHREQFTKPSAITLREILVPVPASSQGINVGADEDARAKAEDARRRVLAGEAFEQVAAEVSTAPSRANGGLIGPLNMAELAPAIQDILKPLEPGDVSEVFRTQAGWQVLKVETKTAEEVLPPEQVRDQIADALYEQKRRAELRKYVATLREQAIIEWKSEDLRKAWLAQTGRDSSSAAEAPLE